MNELTVYNENNMNFKKKIFGGYDKLDVLKKVKELNLKYQGLMQSQKDYYESLIEKIKNGEDISSYGDINTSENSNVNSNNVNNINEKDIEYLLGQQKNNLVAMILEMQQHYDQKIDTYQDNMEENVNYILKMVDQKVDELKMTDNNT